MAERRSSGGGTTRKASASTKSRSSSASRKKTAAKGAGAKKQTTKKAAEETAPELSGKSVADLRNALTRGVIVPLNLVMLTRDRIEEVMDDAVSRGRVTADDAQKLAQ